MSRKKHKSKLLVAITERKADQKNCESLFSMFTLIITASWDFAVAVGLSYIHNIAQYHTKYSNTKR